MKRKLGRQAPKSFKKSLPPRKSYEEILSEYERKLTKILERVGYELQVKD